MKPYQYILIILLLIGCGAYLNQKEKLAVDRSKIPPKVEESNGFQRWITNLRNNDFTTGADEFVLLEENEIYNTKWMKVSSLDDEEKRTEFEQRLAEVQDTKKVVFSPSEREYVDYRNIDRYGYKPNEVYFYGIRDDKIIDSRLVDCAVGANCYFDRAFFLEDSNDVAVVSEFSRNIGDGESMAPNCALNEICTYTIKLHVIDLLRNSRLVYESEPFDINLEEIMPQL